MQQVFERAGFSKSGFITNLDRNDPELIYYKKVASRSYVRPSRVPGHPVNGKSPRGNRDPV